MLSRRNFLERSSLLALTPSVPAFLTRCARAANHANRNSTVLVVIQLDGGNDGINTIVPYADPEYARNRKRLRLATDRLLKINDHVGFHPEMRGAAKLLEEGNLAIVQGVSYPNPDRSHFRSTAIWETGHFVEDPATDKSPGWLGNAFNNIQRPKSGSPDALFVGAGELPVALRGRRGIVSSLLESEDVSLRFPVSPQKAVIDNQTGDSELAEFVRRNVLNAYTTADELSQSTARSTTSEPYPATALAKRLRLISQVIKSGAGIRVYYTMQPGYDTHAIQLPSHANRLSDLSGALKTFVDDLVRANLADRVIVMAFGEFGRRVEENGSFGTDHGTAAPVFLAGSPVKGGLFGTTPKLGDLDANSDLKWSIDFRQVYASLLDNWLEIPSRSILGEQFETLPVV